MDQYDTYGSAIATRWSMPEIILNANRAAQSNPNGAILLLDDYHLIAPHLQPYFFKLFLERKIGNYKLDDRVAIIGTMNDSEESGFNGMLAPIINRIAILNVQFHFDPWFDNFGKHQLHYLVASFLKTKEHYVMEDESVDGPFATSRSWTALSAQLEGLDPEFITQNVKRLASMHVSLTAAEAFAKHVAYVTAIDFTKMVSSRSVPNIAKLSESNPLDGIIHSYLPNFIHTIEDAYFMYDVIDANIDEQSFVGFTVGELYSKYLNDSKSTVGIKFVIDKLLGTFNPANYGLKGKALEKATKYEPKNKPQIMSYAASYITSN